MTCLHRALARAVARALARLATLLATAFLAALVAQPVAAVEPDEILADPKLEQRARALSLELRCLVCQNQSIDDSNAPLARDLRLLVRERLKAGDSDADVMRFVVARYGDFVLLRPPFKLSTLLLWISAPALLLLVAWGMWRALPAAQQSAATASAPSAPLSAEEEARLAALLEADRRTAADGTPSAGTPRAR